MASTVDLSFAASEKHCSDTVLQGDHLVRKLKYPSQNPDADLPTMAEIVSKLLHTLSSL